MLSRAKTTVSTTSPCFRTHTATQHPCSRLGSGGSECNTTFLFARLLHACRVHLPSTSDTDTFVLSGRWTLVFAKSLRNIQPCQATLDSQHWTNYVSSPRASRGSGKTTKRRQLSQVDVHAGKAFWRCGPKPPSAPAQRQSCSSGCASQGTVNEWNPLPWQSGTLGVDRSLVHRFTDSQLFGWLVAHVYVCLSHPGGTRSRAVQAGRSVCSNAATEATTHTRKGTETQSQRAEETTGGGLCQATSSLTLTGTLVAPGECKLTTTEATQLLGDKSRVRVLPIYDCSRNM